MKRIYLSVPMSGLPGLNILTFHSITASLRAGGHTYANPAELNHEGAPGVCACDATLPP
ncbi:DUF4406 domain-containing protein [Pseudomonas sivasensis]|uniref:DUF4406 domain-containing protein n=1 Tax=Pseudomonas sivasensis TaxID=1880678 RepID=A0ABW8DTH6_9PSED